MQNSEFESDQEESGVGSELRVGEVGAEIGAPSRQVVLPPRAVVRIPGQSRHLDDLLVTGPCIPTPTVSTQTRNFTDPVSSRKDTNFHHAGPVAQAKVLVRFSVQFARGTCPSDAIVHRHLQEVQATVPSGYARNEKLWIPQHSAQDIFDAVKCFKYRRQVSDALVRLEANGKIETESTGKFLEDYQWKNNKRDLATWHHVFESLSDEDIMSFRAADAIQYGIPKAMILSAYYGRGIGKFDAQGNAYKKMSASELAKELPFDDPTIGSHLRKLITDKVFVAHHDSAKYVRLRAELSIRPTSW